MITNHPDDLAPLASFAFHFQHPSSGLDPFDVETSSRKKAMAMSVGTFARLETVWGSPPLMWYQLVDARRAPEEITELNGEFLECRQCCGDPGFTLAFKEILNTIGDVDAVLVPLFGSTCGQDRMHKHAS